MAKKSKIVTLTSLIPTVERQEVRADFLAGRTAALAGKTEARDMYAGRLGNWALMNGLVAAAGFVAAGVNAYVGNKTGSDVYTGAAGFDTVVGVLQTCSVYTQLYLRHQLLKMEPNQSFVPPAETPPEHASLAEKAGTYITFGLFGTTLGIAADGLTDL